MASPEAQALLQIARRDLKAAAVLQDPAIDEASWGFQIQLAVEKALKAWLFSLGEEPPLIHNLTALLDRVEDAGGVVEPESMDLDRPQWQQRAVDLVEHVEQIVGSGC